MYGYWNKFIDVDLTTSRVKVVSFDEDILKKFIGGRGLGVWVLWRELGKVWEVIDPLGPENLLLVLTGPLTGFYPGAKVCVTGKSPQSNGVVGSTLSTELAIELRTAGYDGIIIRGSADKPTYLLIVNDRVELRDAKDMWGLGSRETINYIMNKIYPEIRKDLGPCNVPGYIYVGPAGERLVRTAAVMSKLTHAAGYGGYGAVMGSKKLKAIIVKGTGPLPEVANKDELVIKLKELWRTLSRRSGLKEWGTTPGIYNVGYETSSEPIKNWREEWHDRKELMISNFECGVWIKRFWSDFGCPTACMKLSKVIKDGKVFITDGPDYEMGAYLGTNLGVFDVKGLTYLSALADELGLDGINTGNVMGFVAELFEKGILSKDDLGFELRWGDVDAFAKLMEMITFREGIGDLLAEGTYRAALKLSKAKGVDVTKYAVHVKGIAVGAHGVRSGSDYPRSFSYATSVQGGDHTSIASIPIEEGELRDIFYDSAIVCMFNFIDFNKLIEFYNVVTGAGLTPDRWFKELGLRILHLQRALLLISGPDIYWDPRIHDDNPERFYEPLPTGPCLGKSLSRDEVRECVRKYYELVGYDEFGIPKSDVLKSLGLDDVDEKLNDVRARVKSSQVN